MPAMVEKMCHFGQMPWHGHSHPLRGDENLEELVKVSGLDFTVETQPLYRKDADGNYIKYDLGKASVRTDTNADLGCVGNQWTPLQNWDAFKVFEPMVESGLMAWHTAGSLRGGRRIWVLCELDLNPSVIVPGDEVRKFALLSNGHDGKLAVHFGFTPIRVVCANTEALARECKASKLIRVRHHSNVKENVEKLRDIMNTANQEFEATCNEYRTLASRQINASDLRKYVKIVFDCHNVPDDAISTRKLNIIKKVEELFESGRGNTLPGVRGTWWAAYNGLTEYLNYESGRSVDTRLDSLWYGANSNLSRKALNQAVALAA